MFVDFDVAEFRVLLMEFRVLLVTFIALVVLFNKVVLFPLLVKSAALQDKANIKRQIAIAAPNIIFVMKTITFSLVNPVYYIKHLVSLAV